MTPPKPASICPACGRQAVLPPRTEAPNVLRWWCRGGHSWKAGGTR